MTIALSRDVEEQIPAYEAKLRELAFELSRVEEQERHRLAVTLHDRVGQTLALAQIKLESLRMPALSPDLAQGLGHVLELIEQAIACTRSLTAELSPPLLYEAGLAAAIQWWAEQIKRRHGIVITVRDEAQAVPMDEEMRVLLFQAARELLMNVVKHAGVADAEVLIGRDAEAMRLEVSDQGVGFDKKAITENGGFGLFSLHERLKNLGGTLLVGSIPAGGTRAVVTVPLDGRRMGGIGGCMPQY